MIKRGFIGVSFSVLMVFILAISFAAAVNSCSMSVKLINQDPYPATPGDYVKLVFQVSGISNPDCGNVNFELKDKFPITFDPGTSSVYSAIAGGSDVRYGSFLTVPFKVRVSEDAIDGDNQIETALAYSGVSGIWNNFSLSIKDLRADFDVYVKNYDINTHIMTLEVLNVGKTNVQAVTVAIPGQDNIVVKGPNKNVAGDLDANEYTSVDFEVSGGGKLLLQLEYTDESSTRRSVEKTIDFDPNYFQGRKASETKTSIWTYLLIIVIIGAGFWLYRRYRIKKHKKLFS